MKRKQLLILLLVVLVAAIIYATQTTPEQQRVAAGSRVSAGGERSTGDDVPTKESLRLELLDHDDTEYQAVVRDIFHFYTPPPPPPPPPPVVRQPLPPPPPVVAMPPAPPPVAPMVRFVFLGFLDIEEELTVFLSGGDELYVVKNGDSFGANDQFRIEKLTTDELQVSEKDKPGTTQIMLQEENKQPGSRVAPPSVPARSAPLLRRPVPPVNRPQIPSFKRYEP